MPQAQGWPRLSRFASYALSVLLPAAFLALHTVLTSGFGYRPSAIMLIVPTILCALTGGLGPGLVSTGVAIFGDVALTLVHLDGGTLLDLHQMIHWVAFVLCGLLVSFMSERLLRVGRGLVEAEARYSTLFNSMTEGLCLLEMVSGPDGTPRDYIVREVNPAYETILGVKAADVRGRRVTQIFGFETPPNMAEYVKVVRLQQPAHFDTVVPELDKHLRVSAFPVHGKVFVVIFQDVTHRREAEKERQVSARRFRDLFDLAPIALCITDGSTHLVNINQAFVSMFGYSLEDVPTIEDWWRLAYPDPKYREEARSSWREDVLEATRMRTPLVPRVYRITGKNGLVRQCHVFGYPFEKEFLVSFEDVSESLKAQESLRQSELKFRTVADFTYDWEYWRGPEGDIIWMSPACERVSGYSAAEFMADRNLLYRIVHPDDTAIFTKHLGLMTPEDPGTCNLDIRMVKRSGEVIWVNHKCVSIAREDGTPLGRRVCNTDITERKSLALALEESRNVAEASNRTKGEFLANMSHEIRTPLNGMLGMLQLMQADARGEKHEEFVDMALDAGKRLLGLLNDILDVSSMDAGKLALFQAPLRLEDVFDSVNNLFRHACSAKGIELGFHVWPGVPAVLVGDEARLQQILFNLVGNAVKFTTVGSVRVDAWSTPDVRHPDRVRLILSVSDTGIGIPDEQVGYVFQRFTQSDASFSRKFEGAGLGLSIVKRLVELMDGGIMVDSEVGRGTTVYLNLSLGLSAPAAQEAAATVHGNPVEVRLRLLLVEDEAVSRMAVRTMLTRMGHTVTAVSNGLEAVRAVEAQDFDCIFMDIQMPELDGVEATRRIRALQQGSWRPHATIVALTAYAMPGDRERFINAGMDAYLGKPVQEQDLISVLDSLTRHSPAPSRRG